MFVTEIATIVIFAPNYEKSNIFSQSEILNIALWISPFEWKWMKIKH